MKKGITSTLAFELEIQVSDVEQVIFTFKEKVNSEEYLLQKEYPSESVIFEDNKFKCKLTQEETDSLSNTFFVEAQINLSNKSVIKSDICKKIMPPTLWTTFVEDNESSGNEEIISLTFTDYVEGGGSGGTTNYNELSNKPRFNGIEWVGNKTDSDMGIATKGELQTKADKSDTYTKEETNTFLNAKADKDTTYTKTETDNLLDDKQDTLADGNGIKIENDEISVDLKEQSYLNFNSQGQMGIDFALPLDTAFRTRLVNTNYSNPLASKSYVDNLMSGTTKWEFVSQLPTEDIDIHTIYFVPKESAETDNIYDEWVYAIQSRNPDVYDWELLGTSQVDLSNYYTKTESNNRYPLKIYTYTKQEVDYAVIEKAFRNLSSARYTMGQSESGAVALNVADYDTLKITATTMTTSNSYKLDNETKQTFSRADLPLTIDVSSASKFYAWSGFTGEYLTYDLTNTDFDYATKSDLSSKQDTIDSTHKLSADNVDDTNTTNKFVSANEKQTWNAKADNTTITTDTSATTVSLTLADNHEYRYTQELSSLTLTMPSGDFISSIVFASGSTPTSMTYDSNIKWSGNDVTSNAFVPQANQEYEIVFWYNGLSINAVVRGVA